MKENVIRKHLHERAKALGGSHRAVKWISRKHAPDDLLLFPGPPGRPGRHVFVESKAPDEAARAGQLREHERMRAAGCEVLLLDTIEKIDAAFPLPLTKA